MAEAAFSSRNCLPPRLAIVDRHGRAREHAGSNKEAGVRGPTPQICRYGSQCLHVVECLLHQIVARIKMATNGNVVVGFVGLGTMGARMAASLQKGGYRLVVHDLHREAAARHLSNGAIWADTPRALASQVDVIFSSLPEPADGEAVALG